MIHGVQWEALPAMIEEDVGVCVTERVALLPNFMRLQEVRNGKQ